MTLIAMIGCNTNKSADDNADVNPDPKETVDAQNEHETFNPIDSEVIDNLNTQIIALEVTTIEQVVNLYKPKEESTEGNYSYTISHEAIDEQTVEATLIEAGLLDDSVEGVKSVIRINQAGKVLKVTSIKENYRCYRGHKDWSAEKCM